MFQKLQLTNPKILRNIHLLYYEPQRSTAIVQQGVGFLTAEYSHIYTGLMTPESTRGEFYTAQLLSFPLL